ncbi:unnamed protein product [Didymodactylos carnosus]|uniref:Uncharacterized protein n=1 Tax=Didymodactylos carnosus TaxID=1234261 RepID=A0A814XZB8_9BILA|nr:unnamed protein product [Didymodactylos carnosus]CAF1222600.1 unnamed protein product [Didymodactylos carnosus]CAF3862521.1 unnamed protein product [Didymodactylos carnosus]CAF3985819.1 unnamed protein product [Didymodactylos carnosus]
MSKSPPNKEQQEAMQIRSFSATILQPSDQNHNYYNSHFSLTNGPTNHHKEQRCATTYTMLALSDPFEILQVDSSETDDEIVESDNLATKITKSEYTVFNPLFPNHLV